MVKHNNVFEKRKKKILLSKLKRNKINTDKLNK